MKRNPRSKNFTVGFDGEEAKMAATLTIRVKFMMAEAQLGGDHRIQHITIGTKTPTNVIQFTYRDARLTYC